MRLSIISFTRQGSELCVRLARGLTLLGHECDGYEMVPKSNPVSRQGKRRLLPVKTSLGDWTGEQFSKQDGLIFIGAAGIAVRAIAPYIKNKREDSAVVVVDDLGRFSVSLLSGHLGGANELARQAAAVCGAAPVITTATDSRGVFAVDEFARKNSLALTDLKLAKEISARLLDGRAVAFYSDYPVEGQLPSGLVRDGDFSLAIWVTGKEAADSARPQSDFQAKRSRWLRLIPKTVVLGIGCRKGVLEATIWDAVCHALHAHDLAAEGVAAVATIDLKKEEAGLLAVANRLNAAVFLYSAEVLSEVEGEFSSSPFVMAVTGVDNVCERAAMACVRELGGGALLVKKEAADGVTVAVAIRDWKVLI